ncbi:MAG: 50S ribosomal protein L11 methyltransferase [Bacteroidota bacterium]
MDYYQYRFHCSSELNEILIALLSQYPFDTFQEQEDGLEAYIPAKLEEEAIATVLEDWQQQFDFKYERIFVKAQNWNAVWESNFHPIIVGDFCGIRADFHDPIPNVQHELIIQPKMAFGTGHHATTFQVIQMMEQLPLEGAKVFDYGCGTGILAILASKLGASRIDAIDIDEWSKENTEGNATLNQVENINVWQGDLTSLHDKGYDCIFANITFNVISSSLTSLYTKLHTGGHLITSGFFPTDAMRLKTQAKALGMRVIQESQKGDWACVYFQK